jgi:hypothetical protein
VDEVRKGTRKPGWPEGRPLSVEHREAIRRGLLGQRYPAERRAAIAAGMRRYRAEQRRKWLEEEGETRGVTG